MNMLFKRNYFEKSVEWFSYYQTHILLRTFKNPVFFYSNMYSHVLAVYQKSLLAFWAKTSKIMTAVAESFQGYQYYEFTVIKDLAEPSRLLAEMNSNVLAEKTKASDKNEAEPTTNETTTGADTLINFDESTNNPTQEPTKLIDVIETSKKIS